ncbi:LasR-specific antiactivator QslA [Pseudomonas kuykendallii]|uniref:LasR-specific antiactivator QslA n=1 Tax=Pseudomonas kuykendallii TaxID=1007099 RepID=UPI0028D826F9|nr:LasR-specific antiactivator QslA [Pseudomonas kuykendallii]
MGRRGVCRLAAHDEHPGVEINLPARQQAAFDLGANCAQAWLASPNPGWLWAGMLAERDLLRSEAARRAFDIGFLSRLHQRLRSPGDGGRPSG